MSQLSYKSGTSNIPAGTLYVAKNVVVQQTRGTSTSDVMSQNSVTSELQNIDTQIINLTLDKLNKSDAKQTYLSIEDAKTNYAPIGNYAYVEDIPELPDFTKYLLKSELPTVVSYFENDAQYLTKTALDANYYDIQKINELINGVRADNENWLHNFYDKDQINLLLKKYTEDQTSAHEEFNTRLTELESIDHNVFATKQSLEVYATKESVTENYYDKETVDSKISDAIAGENIGDLLSKREAEETYQKIGDYATNQEVTDRLGDYYTKSETDTAISNVVDQSVTELKEELNVEQYETKVHAEETYQPIGDYLTEHQDISHLMTVSRAEEEHNQLKEEFNEFSDRLKIAETLAANFVEFRNWQLGYFEEHDHALSNKIEHDGCYHIICDVTNCRRDNFFAHYAPVTNNYYIFEYSGEPAEETYIKSVKKENFDLIFELDLRTKYIVACAYNPNLTNTDYYLRGIKIDAEEENNHVELEYLQQNYYDKTEVDSKISEIDITSQLENYYNKSEVDQKISEIDITDELENYYDKSEIDQKFKESEVDLTGYAKESYVDGKISDLIGSAPETYNTLQEIAEYIEEHKSVEIALNEAIGTKANKTELQEVKESVEEINESVDGLDSRLQVVENKPFDKYLTEHQSLKDYLKIVDFDNVIYSDETYESQEFANWISGNITNPEEGKNSNINSDDSYFYQFVEVPKSCDTIVCHYPNTMAEKIYCYSGEPSESTYIKYISGGVNTSGRYDYEYKLPEDTKFVCVKEFKVSSISHGYIKFKGLLDKFTVLENKIPLPFDDSQLKDRLSKLEEIEHDDFLSKEDIKSIEDTLGNLIVKDVTDYPKENYSFYELQAAGLTYIYKVTTTGYKSIILTKEDFKDFNYLEVKKRKERNKFYVTQFNSEPKDKADWYIFTETHDSLIKINPETEYIAIGGYGIFDDANYEPSVKLYSISGICETVKVIDSDYITDGILKDTLVPYAKTTYVDSEIKTITDKHNIFEDLIRPSVFNREEITYTDWEEGINKYGSNIFTDEFTEKETCSHQFFDVLNWDRQVEVSAKSLKSAGWGIIEFSEEGKSLVTDLNFRDKRTWTLRDDTRYLLVNTEGNVQTCKDSGYYVKATVNMLKTDILNQKITVIENQLSGIDELLSEILGD